MLKWNSISCVLLELRVIELVARKNNHLRLSTLLNHPTWVRGMVLQKLVQCEAFNVDSLRKNRPRNFLVCQGKQMNRIGLDSLLKSWNNFQYVAVLCCFIPELTESSSLQVVRKNYQCLKLLLHLLKQRRGTSELTKHFKWSTQQWSHKKKGNRSPYDIWYIYKINLFQEKLQALIIAVYTSNMAVGASSESVQR